MSQQKDAALGTGLVGALLIGVFLFQNAIAALWAAWVRGAALHAAPAQP